MYDQNCFVLSHVHCQKCFAVVANFYLFLDHFGLKTGKSLLPQQNIFNSVATLLHTYLKFINFKLASSANNGLTDSHLKISK